MAKKLIFLLAAILLLRVAAAAKEWLPTLSTEYGLTWFSKKPMITDSTTQADGMSPWMVFIMGFSPLKYYLDFGYGIFLKGNPV